MNSSVLGTYLNCNRIFWRKVLLICKIAAVCPTPPPSKTASAPRWLCVSGTGESLLHLQHTSLSQMTRKRQDVGKLSRPPGANVIIMSGAWQCIGTVQGLPRLWMLGVTGEPLHVQLCLLFFACHVTVRWRTRVPSVALHVWRVPSRPRWSL